MWRWALLTKVQKNEPCPPLQPPLAGADPGRLVLTTVNHLNPDVWELTCEPIRGPPGGSIAEDPAAHTLRPTGAHKFYSETRHDWAATNELQPGEVIRGRGGLLRVTRARPLPGVERVYNLTVEGEHVYYVSELGLLAHNNCPVSKPGEDLFVGTYNQVRRGNINFGLNETHTPHHAV